MISNKSSLNSMGKLKKSRINIGKRKNFILREMEIFQ